MPTDEEISSKNHNATIVEKIVGKKKIRINIDEIGEFRSMSLFPEGIKHQNNTALAKLGKRNIISFKPSRYLTKAIA